MKIENSKINILKDAIGQSFKKLSPRVQVKNPVMLVVYVGAIITTILFLLTFVGIKDESHGYTLAIALILWFTLLFVNFAVAIAEGRARAQANSLRSARKDVKARKLKSSANLEEYEEVFSSDLRKGNIIYVKVDEQIPMDGEVIDGAASVDESAITGESAPVTRESGGDRSAVTGGTKVLSDWIKMRISADPGETFLDRMIHLVEAATRQKTPNEIALTILLVGLTIIFLLAVVTLEPFAIYSGVQVTIPVLIALLVCLIPTTIGGLLSAIGIAGMDRMIQ